MKTLLLTASVCLSSVLAFSQTCLPPTGATIATTTSSCPNNGSITVSNVSGGTPQSIEYKLQSTNPLQSSTPYQNNNVFQNIYPGVYTILVRNRCANGDSSSNFSIQATISGNYQNIAATFSNIRAAYCQDGGFQVNATLGNTATSGSYGYQLVSAQGATQPDPAAPGAMQSSNVFSGLSAGTYYVRIFDDCQAFRTFSVVVPAAPAPTNPYLSSSYNKNRFHKTTCDSMYFGLQTPGPTFDLLSNYSLKAPITTRLHLPDGTTVSNTTYNWSTGDTLIPIQGFIDQGIFGPFYVSVVDSCGRTFSSDTSYVDTALSLNPLMSRVVTCDSVKFFIVLNSVPGRVTLGPNKYKYYVGPNDMIAGLQYTVDSGLTWSNTNTFTFVNANKSLRYGIRICGKTSSMLNFNYTVPSFTLKLQEQHKVACAGNSGYYGTSGSLGSVNSFDSVKIHFISYPAGQPALPYYMNTTGREWGQPSNSTAMGCNLMLGTYVYEISNTCGQTRTDTLVLSSPLTNSLTSNYIPACNGVSNIHFNYSTTTMSAGFSVKLRVKIRDLSTGAIVSNVSKDFSNIASGMISFDSTLNNFSNGQYEVQAYIDTTFIKTGATCVLTDTLILAPAPALNPQSSLFTTCNGTNGQIRVIPGGGVAPYTYELYNGPVAPANLLASQTDSVFNNLNPNMTYTVRVIDACGSGSSVSKSFGTIALQIFQDIQACTGNNVQLYADNVPGALYAWRKGSGPVLGTQYTLQLNNLALSDSGIYHLDVIIPGCDTLNATKNLNVSDCTPLPVNLLGFDGTLNKDARAELQWTVSGESNLKQYKIERSGDGVRFEQAGIVAANNLGLYHFTDHTYVVNNAVLYRLLMEDFDGSNTASRTIKLSRNGRSDSKLSLSPVPFHEHLNIRYTGDDDIVRLRILNSLGITVIRMEKIESGNAEIRINTKDLPSGIYILEAETIGRKVIRAKVSKE